MPNARPQDSTSDFSSRLLRSVLLAALVVVVLLCFWYTSYILMVIFAGCLVAIFLRSLSAALSCRTPLSDGWALAAVSLALVGVGALLFWLLAPEVTRQVDELSRTLPESMKRLQEQLASTGTGRWFVDRFSDANEWVSSRRAVSQATTVLSTTAGAVAGFFIMLALGLYLAAEPEFYREGVVRLFPPARRERVRQVLLEVGETLRWWLIGKFAGMFVIGLLTWLGLLALGIPLALTLGLIAAVLTFIPNFGPILAVIPAILLGLVESPSRAVYVLVLYLAIQAVESYIITPLIQRRTIRLPPALTISAQMIFGTMLGALGVALATPLAAALLVCVRKLYVEDTLETPGPDPRPDQNSPGSSGP